MSRILLNTLIELIVILNFPKISLKPPWSIFIISQKPEIIFKSNQSHWKANSIIYNFHVYTKSKFKTENGENCEYFPNFPHRKSVADFRGTKIGKSAQQSGADFGNSGADFELHSSSKISLTMRFSLKNHSWITRLNTRLPN
ncbi:hypothetical protein MTR_0116s0140 [Medicago truncatula]|uniref:Uncharacterized protein n=1 Tax=Medicago truncatula TaxID=3880 RepID=A0A072TIF0_MEDTR|nr:hypothetical protein MTR_0116s0140 [Medicago truncatula]